MLPPQLTLDRTEDFNDGVANHFTGDAAGAVWSVSSGRYVATATLGSTSLQTVDLGVDHLQATSYLELKATLRTSGIGGIVFDENSTNHFKYVALDVAAQKVLIGHYEPKRGFVVDTSVTRTLLATTDYTLDLTMKGASVSVTLNGAFVLSWGFNAPVVDGAVGVLAQSGTTSVDSFRIRTNDPAFPQPPAPLLASEAAPAGPMAAVREEELRPLLAEARQLWLATGLVDAAAFDGVTVRVADLGAQDAMQLGQTVGNLITIDDDAAGWGWFVDGTPEDNTEFQRRTRDGDLVAVSSSAAGHMDLLTVLTHELGHVLGRGDEDPVTHAHDVMAATLAAGVRRLAGTPLALPEALPSRSLRTPGQPAVRHIEWEALPSRSLRTPGQPAVRRIEWAADTPPPAALVFDAGAGTSSRPSVPLSLTAASQAGSTTLRHAAQIVWENAEAERRLAEHEPLTPSAWWRHIRRLFQRDTGAAVRR